MRCWVLAIDHSEANLFTFLVFDDRISAKLDFVAAGSDGFKMDRTLLLGSDSTTTEVSTFLSFSDLKNENGKVII